MQGCIFFIFQFPLGFRNKESSGSKIKRGGEVRGKTGGKRDDSSTPDYAMLIFLSEIKNLNLVYPGIELHILPKHIRFLSYMQVTGYIH